MGRTGDEHDHRPDVPGRLPVVAGSTIGIVANPMSGRDIRRLVAQASVFPNSEKTSMVLRLLGAAGALGVHHALISTDGFGIARGVLRAARRHIARRDGRWPRLEFCELDPVTGTAQDTRTLVARMRRAGADVIVLLGGDGTIRAAADELGDLPVLALSTGTNNAFPEVWESTVAGTATALLATGRVDRSESTCRAKALRVVHGRSVEQALVDVCVCAAGHVGARALWRVDQLREVYCAFAEPHAIGFSSVAGQLRPTSRSAPGGVALRVASGAEAERTVLAPIAPGTVAEIGVADVRDLPPGRTRTSDVPAGALAVDGEREFEFGPRTPITVTLTDTGPRVVDVRAVLNTAAHRRLLARDPAEQHEEPLGGIAP